MAKNTSKTTIKNTASVAGAPRGNTARQPQTLERAISLCPHLKLMENIANTFPLPTISSEGAAEFAAHIRDSTEEHVAKNAQDLAGTLSDTAMAIHLQRVVAAYVSSAIGAGTYYQGRVSVMRDMNTKLANEDRDEDRDGPAGFESKAERARQFAADTAAQAFTLLAAAEGAVSAFAHITGDEWKAYQPPQEQAQSISRKSAAEQMGAFEG